MRSIAVKLALPVGMLLACAARSTMDLEEESRVPSGGSPNGGQTGGRAGYPGAGGMPASGGTTASGGVIAGGGGARLSDGSLGSGGVFPTGGTSGIGGNPCQGPAPKEDMIDDLNDGDRYILSTNRRVGSWKVDNDGTPGGMMSPDPVSGFTPTNTGDACRQYAAYTKGYGFSSRGASMSFGLGSPYSAHDYTGISFWARIDSGTKDVVRVNFPDKDTDPRSNLCKTGVTGPTACYDHYGMRLTLSTAWTKHTIGFDELTQDGSGMQGKAFDSGSLYEIAFQIPENATFGLWIDDVAFIRLPDLVQ
jgi:hypothetical protein